MHMHRGRRAACEEPTDRIAILAIATIATMFMCPHLRPAMCSSVAVDVLAVEGVVMLMGMKVRLLNFCKQSDTRTLVH